MDIVDQLRGHCKGHPFAVAIPWPHRVLHDAIAEIERLRGLLGEIVDDEDCQYDHHGYCQTHNLGERPCVFERARQEV